MADKTNNLQTLLAALTLFLGAVPVLAQDAASEASERELVETILCETDAVYFAENGWTPELADLDCAGDAVAEYAYTHENGVGILLHVGDDLRQRAQTAAEEHDVPVDQAMSVMIQRIEDYYREEFAPYAHDVGLFPRMNYDARATGVTFHLDVILYENAEGNPLLDLGEANREIERVSEALLYINENLRGTQELNPSPRD